MGGDAEGAGLVDQAAEGAFQSNRVTVPAWVPRPGLAPGRETGSNQKNDKTEECGQANQRNGRQE